MRLFIRIALVLCTLTASDFVRAAEPRSLIAPKLDVKKIVNASYSFRKNQEPEMTEDEYALYERVVAMVSFQPEFALRLLETMTSGAEQTSPAFEFVLGNVYFTNNRYDLAEKHYRAALQRYPEFTRVWSNLGALLYSQGRYADAAECLGKTIAAGDRDARTLGLLAFCLNQTGRKIAAEMNYIQALGLEPDNPDFLEGLLTLYYNDKQYARAEPLLKQLIRQRPQDARNWQIYASLLVTSNRELEAIGLLESAHSLGALDDDGLIALAGLYGQRKFHAEAIDTYQRLSARSPNRGIAPLLAFAENAIAEGHLKPAANALDTVAREVPPAHRVSYFQARSNLFVARKDWSGAIKELQTLLQIEPLNGRALLTLGRVYKATDDFARADVAFEAATQEPEFAYRASLELADLAVKSSRFSRALDFLERAEAIETSVAIQSYITKIRLVLTQHENSPTPQ